MKSKLKKVVVATVLVVSLASVSAMAVADSGAHFGNTYTGNYVTTQWVKMPPPYQGGKPVWCVTGVGNGVAVSCDWGASMTTSGGSSPP